MDLPTKDILIEGTCMEKEFGLHQNQTDTKEIIIKAKGTVKVSINGTLGNSTKPNLKMVHSSILQTQKYNYKCINRIKSTKFLS